ncbi:MAG TPA: response regulator, partial [Candidatus Methylacidiphilales bacterium]
PQGGHLKVRAQNLILDERLLAKQEGVAPGPFVVLSVGDSGCGMPAEVLERIFEPLFTTKEPGKGSGLGLSTVIGIVRRLGGFVAVESVVGRGTTFKLHFPALSVGEGNPDHEGLPLRSDIPLGGGRRVLFVDDDNVVRRVSKAMMENYGYRVVTAANGVEALGIAKTEKDKGTPFELVISDVDMPYMDGFEFLMATRADEATKPFIFISGTPLEDHYLIEIERSGLDFIPKPYTVEQLLRASARQLGLVGEAEERCAVPVGPTSIVMPKE